MRVDAAVLMTQLNIRMLLEVRCAAGGGVECPSTRLVSRWGQGTACMPPT